MFCLIGSMIGSVVGVIIGTSFTNYLRHCEMLKADRRTRLDAALWRAIG